MFLNLFYFKTFFFCDPIHDPVRDPGRSDPYFVYAT